MSAPVRRIRFSLAVMEPFLFYFHLFSVSISSCKLDQHVQKPQQLHTRRQKRRNAKLTSCGAGRNFIYTCEFNKSGKVGKCARCALWVLLWHAVDESEVAAAAAVAAAEATATAVKEGSVCGTMHTHIFAQNPSRLVFLYHLLTILHISSMLCVPQSHVPPITQYAYIHCTGGCCCLQWCDTELHERADYADVGCFFGINSCECFESVSGSFRRAIRLLVPTDSEYRKRTYFFVEFRKREQRVIEREQRQSGFSVRRLNTDIKPRQKSNDCFIHVHVRDKTLWIKFKFLYDFGSTYPSFTHTHLRHTHIQYSSISFHFI